MIKDLAKKSSPPLERAQENRIEEVYGKIALGKDPSSFKITPVQYT